MLFCRGIIVKYTNFTDEEIKSHKSCGDDRFNKINIVYYSKSVIIYIMGEQGILKNLENY